MYALMNSQFDVIPRLEYVRYLAWAAERLRDVHYGVTVDRVSFGDGGFTVEIDGPGSDSVSPSGAATTTLTVAWSKASWACGKSSCWRSAATTGPTASRSAPRSTPTC